MRRYTRGWDPVVGQSPPPRRIPRTDARILGQNRAPNEQRDHSDRERRHAEHVATPAGGLGSPALPVRPSEPMSHREIRVSLGVVGVDCYCLLE